jgi:hypothetical protein
MSAEYVVPSLLTCLIKVAGDAFGIAKEDLVLIVPDTDRDRNPRSIGISGLFFSSLIVSRSSRWDVC